MANKHMKRCSTSLIIREVKIKTTMSYHHKPVRMTIIKKSTVNAGEDVEKREPSCTVGANVNWFCHLVQPPSIEDIPLKTKEKKKSKKTN